MLAAALAVLTPSAALADTKPAPNSPGTYTVDFDSESAQYWYIICLKSTTTMKKYPAGGGDRNCTPKYDGIAADRNKTFLLAVDYTEGDSVYVDFEMFIIGSDSRTVNDIDVTDAHNCDFNGLVSNGKFWCDWPKGGAETYSPPAIEAFKVNTGDPEDPVMKLLNLLAWCVSAASVAGLLIVGAQMAMQLRRGVTGEKANEYVRPLTIIAAACLISATAGPLVQWFGFDQ
ncbi:hypothetical protein [Actinoplanes sp. NPDC051851]|uniref:hypothetical protein n=1 Tax=Actinoplanes sp. NPDC051851 TaxID=3154753 RepID=UPI0034415342